MSTRDDPGLHWDRWPNAGTREEYRRLRLIEEAYDAHTIPQLERLDPRPGWRCLEIGAGAGSIARWLAGRVGAANVVATELKTEFLAPIEEQGIRVVQHDVTVDAPVGTAFDLIHARLVLEHLPARDDVMARLASWLAPGGWLVLEECSFFPPMAADPVFRRVEEALMKLLAASVGTDLTWGRTFPLPFERAGLTDTDAVVSSPVLRGGSTFAEVLEVLLVAAAPGLVASGMVTSDDVDGAVTMLRDDHAMVDYSILGIIGRGRRGA